MMATTNSPCVAEQDNDVYDWSQEQQGIILSSFYWGFVITQVPGALLSQRYGGKYVMMFGILFSAICSILTPIVVQESKFSTFFSFSSVLYSFGWHEFLRVRYYCYNDLFHARVNEIFEKATIYQSAIIIQLHNQFFSPPQHYHDHIE